jgi:hypothetical protein
MSSNPVPKVSGPFLVFFVVIDETPLSKIAARPFGRSDEIAQRVSVTERTKVRALTSRRFILSSLISFADSVTSFCFSFAGVKEGLFGDISFRF